jgi:hypothetical protein
MVAPVGVAAEMFSWESILSCARLVSGRVMAWGAVGDHCSLALTRLAALATLSRMALQYSHISLEGFWHV